MDIYPNIQDAKYIAVDVETEDPNLKKLGPGGIRGDGKLVGVGLHTSTGWSHYYPIDHSIGDNLPRETVVNYLSDQLNTPIEKVGANLQYDLEWLWLEGVKTQGPYRDIQVAEPLIDEERRGGYSLNALAKHYLGFEKFEEGIIEEAKKLGIPEDKVKDNLRNMSPYEVGRYCMEDCRLSLDVYLKQIPILLEQELWDVFELESKILPIVLQMRFHGVRVDVKKAEHYSKVFKASEERLLEYIKKYTGMDIDPWSNEQIAEYLDSVDMEYPRTKKGNPNLEGEWLREHNSEILRVIGRYRKIERQRVNYIDRIVRLHVNGRVHPRIWQLAGDEYGVRSGRLSMSDFNLQQITKRDPYWRRVIRECFLPDEGCFWGEHDYSQQEPRLFVHFAYKRNFKGAEQAREYYINDPNPDLHVFAAELANTGRREGKDLNLGAMYVMGKAKLMKRFKKSLEEAIRIYDTYHAKLPFVKKLIDDTKKWAERRGWIRSILGRRKHYLEYEPRLSWAELSEMWEKFGRDFRIKPVRPDKIEDRKKQIFEDMEKARSEEKKEELKFELEKWNRPIQRAWTYRAINNLIQMSAADQTKLAMLAIYEKYGHVRFLQIQIHDAINGSYKNKQEFMEVAQIMTDAIQLTVPTKVDSSMGPSWGEVVEC